MSCLLTLQQNSFPLNIVHIKHILMSPNIMICKQSIKTHRAAVRRVCGYKGYFQIQVGHINYYGIKWYNT